jgi:hypothetical protein
VLDIRWPLVSWTIDSVALVCGGSFPMLRLHNFSDPDAAEYAGRPYSVHKASGRVHYMLDNARIMSVSW